MLCAFARDGSDPYAPTRRVAKKAQLSSLPALLRGKPAKETLAGHLFQRSMFGQLGLNKASLGSCHGFLPTDWDAAVSSASFSCGSSGPFSFSMTTS
jgi:hypothetical protein